MASSTPMPWALRLPPSSWDKHTWSLELNLQLSLPSMLPSALPAASSIPMPMVYRPLPSSRHNQHQPLHLNPHLLSSIPISPPTTNSVSTALATSGSSASSGLTSSAKIGIGLGIPLGLFVLASIAFLVHRYIGHKRRSWHGRKFSTPQLRHEREGEIAGHSRGKKQGIIGSVLKYKQRNYSGIFKLTQLHHDVAEEEKQRDFGRREEDNGSMAKIKGTSEEAMQNIDRPGSLNIHELHGTDTPPHSRELEGSPGVKRHELPARRSMRRGSV